MLSNFLLFQGVLSVINTICLLIIVFFLEKNLRMNWLIKSELNLFSILLFLSLGGVLLREIIFVWAIWFGYFTGTISNFLEVKQSTPSLIINLGLTFTLLITAVIIYFKDMKIFVVNRSGKIWFKVLRKGKEV